METIVICTCLGIMFGSGISLLCAYFITKNVIKKALRGISQRLRNALMGPTPTLTTSELINELDELAK